MRRIVNATSVSICVQFALGTAHLFAASDDFNSNSGNPGIFGAILGVVVPALLVIGIGCVIYVWLRRNKSSFSGLFPRRQAPKNWDISPPTYTASAPSHRSPHDAVPPDNLDPLTEPNRQLESDEYTLESIALADLEGVLSLRESNRIQEYYEAIAIIIKQYVGEKYHIKSLDAPTGQILSALPNGLTDSVTDHVGEILLSCDMVQFSRHRPSRSELDRIYQTAREFLESQIVVALVEADEFEADEEADEDSEMYRHYRRRLQG
ncbi:hypothetical protein C6502_16435 [Candidatus Poribacteria bacterium]|nr:MAG: hypothetical protein C6502_16435 [Candidatus Poribacteria bacterium]